VAKVSSNVRIFADFLIYNNYDPCIYSSDNFYATNLDSSVKDLPLWVANYGASMPIATNFVGFQFSNTGVVDGVNGPVDLNDFSSGIFIDSVNPQPIVNTVVRTFQHATNLVGLRDVNGNRLVEDGIIGIRTRQVIAKVFVTSNATGELVRWIQHRLIALGFNCGPAGADSIFGPLTLGAVKRFQTSRGLDLDGIVGPLTTMQFLR
ncbi:peptidoglycan-binding protein, partial [Clostridium estertheticum]|uniref:peptidoglycan-binding protein n=1 Tax=Clostridium estertheticum TaxID=238834 RepID=UPI001C0A9CB0